MKLFATVRVPVWQHFIRVGHHQGDPGQLSYPGIVSLGMQHLLGEGKRGQWR